jgi:hypothetical protein
LVFHFPSLKVNNHYSSPITLLFIPTFEGYYLGLTVEQHALDINAGKQLFKAATDVKVGIQIIAFLSVLFHWIRINNHSILSSSKLAQSALFENNKYLDWYCQLSSFEA